MIPEMIRAALEKRISGRAAEVSFYGMLSIFPVLLLVAGALGPLEILIGHDLAARAEAKVIRLLNLVLTEKATAVVDAAGALFDRQSGGLMTTAAFVSFWTLSSAFCSVIETLDISYGITERRSWIRLRLTAFVIAIGSTLTLAMVLVGVAARPLLGTGRYLAAHLGLGDGFAFVWDWLWAPVAFAILVLWATTVYHLAPNKRNPWLRDLPGGFMAAVLWLVVSLGLNLYLQVAAGINQVLGLLGGGLILMIWIYLLSFVLLLGGEVNGRLRRGGTNLIVHRDNVTKSQ